MKRTALITAALVIIAGSTTGCQDSRVTNLERRLTGLEQQVTGLEQRLIRLEQSTQKLESELKKSADEESNRSAKLPGCLSDANAAYEENVMKNGTKDRNGTYYVPPQLLDELRRQKQAKIEECKLLYSK